MPKLLLNFKTGLNVFPRGGKCTLRIACKRNIKYGRVQVFGERKPRITGGNANIMRNNRSKRTHQFMLPAVMTPSESARAIKNTQVYKTYLLRTITKRNQP